MDHSSILFNEPPLVVSPRLAKLVGLNEAIILQQLHYWLQRNPKVRDGRRWIYNSIPDWQRQFPFWGVDTVKRTIAKLVTSKLVIKGDYNKSSFDKTSWYSLDYSILNLLIAAAPSMSANCTDGQMQDAPMDEGSMHRPIPETSTETISTKIKKVSKKEAALPAFDELIAGYTSNPKLKEAIREFIRMRVSMKKVPTNRALEIIFEKLDKMAPNDEAKTEIVNRSIVNNWGDVFELKPPPGSLKPPPKKTGGSPLEDLEDFLKEERDE